MIRFRCTTNPRVDEFLGILDEFFFEEPRPFTSRECPIHDVIENDKEYIIELVLAGIPKEDIKIDIDENSLTVNAVRNEPKDVKFNRKESYFGKYERVFKLPNNTDKENIEAKLADGILKVTVPKILDESKLRKKTVNIN